MKQRSLQYMLICGLTLMVSACFNVPDPSNAFRDRSTDYLKIKPVPPIKTPSDFDSRALGDIMVIPNSAFISDEHPSTFEVPQPNRDDALQTSTRVYQIDRLNGNQVILAHHSVDKTWLAILPFWKKQYKTLAVSDPKQHLIETNWVTAQAVDDTSGLSLNRLFGLAPKASQGRFRVRVKDSALAGDSYVSVQYASVAGDNHSASVSVNWDRQNEDDLRVAHDKLNQLLVYLNQQALKTTETTTSAAPPKTPTEVLDGRSYLKVDGNGSPILQIDLPYAEAWMQVNTAIKAAGIELTDQNQSAGLFYISIPNNTITNSTKKPSSGWFAKKPITAISSPYQLRLSTLNDGKIHLALEKDVDTLAKADLSNYILAKIQSHL